MFILPIGHENQSFRRLPWVTISIALICTALRVHACSGEDGATGTAIGTARRLDNLIESVATECLRKSDCPIDDESTREDVAELIRTGKIGDPLQQELFASLDAAFDEDLSRLPARQLGLQPASFSVLSLSTYMFAHGSFMHLVGNMLLLYLIGLTIEERWGRLRFSIFYLAGGVVSGLTYAAFHWDSSTPLVGASGAIAAAMGAFVVLYARTKIKFFYFFWFIIFKAGTFRLPAWVVLPLWFLEQLWSISDETSGGSSVGYTAHAGGFAFGVIVALIIRAAGLDRRFKYQIDLASGERAEDPNYLDAVALAEKSEDRAALNKLTAVLAKNPNHAAARELTYELAKKTRNLPLLEKYAAELFPVWSRSASSRVLDGYRAITALARKDQPIDENLLDHVLTAATALSELAIAQDVMRRLFLQDRNSVRVPKALWSVAQIHIAQGREDLATPFVERLLRDHPASPWTAKARAFPIQRNLS